MSLEISAEDEIISEHYEYYPQLISDADQVFEELYNYLMNGEFCVSYKIKMGDKEFDSRRISCVVSDSERARENVWSPAKWSWADVPALEPIRAIVEEKANTSFDYCLIHIYRDGNDAIGWHNDKEALNSSIASVSLGATRKFRFRKIEERKGWEAEFSLKSGDVVLMRDECQHHYKHTVPVEKRVKESRINLTFRHLE